MKTTSIGEKGRGFQKNSIVTEQSKNTNFSAFRALNPRLSSITGRPNHIGEIIGALFQDYLQKGGESEASH